MELNQEMQEQKHHSRHQGNISLYPHWQLIFDKYDRDSDGKISLAELKHMLQNEALIHDIPEYVIRQIIAKADKDVDGFLDYEEFLKMTEQKEVRGIMLRTLNRYIKATVVPRHYVTDVTDLAGDYEREYSCYPPAICMIIISFIELLAFMWDVIKCGESTINGPAAILFIFNPFKRYEAWRFLTYMFIHVGVFHMIVNLMVQIMLGIPLEMVHGWWRVLVVYVAGVIAGSLGTSVSDPGVYLAGASGGVYAIITAHLATICLNWSEMKFAWLQLLVFLLLAVVDVGTAVYTRYVLKAPSQIGYVAHLAGAVAGLLVGINVLRNLEVKRWEKVLWWVSIIIFISLILAAIIWNAAFPSYFPAHLIFHLCNK